MSFSDTDPVPEAGQTQYRYPLLARWFGIDVAVQQIVDALAVTPDQEALEEALATLRAADQTVDAIEPDK